MDKKNSVIFKMQVVIFIIILSLFISPGICEEDTINVMVQPNTLSVFPQQSFTLSIYCQPNQAIKSYELSLSFDAVLLQIDEVSEGDIFNGYSTFFNDGTIDNELGTLSLIYGLIIGPGNVSEEGTLVDISFTAKNSIGSSDITITTVGITNETTYLPLTVSNGSIFIQDHIPIIENETIIFSDPIDTDASFGWCNITCDIIDDNVDEVSLILTHPDDTVTSNSLLNSFSDHFFLNLSTIEPGSYSFYISVYDVLGNHVVTESESFVIPPNWDVTMDGQVSVIDLITISNRFSTSGELGWIREDVDNNGVVELSDIILVSGHYGQTW